MYPRWVNFECVSSEWCGPGTPRPAKGNAVRKMPVIRTASSKEGENLGQIPPPADHANRRKKNSHTHAPPQRRPAYPRIPDDSRGRTAAQGHQGQPMVAPGLNNDPCGLPPWPQGEALQEFLAGLSPA